MPIINKDEAVLVYPPKSLMLNVNTMGYMIEVNNPMIANDRIEKYPVVSMAINTRINAPPADTTNIFGGANFFRMNEPTSLPKSTNPMKTLMNNADFCSVNPGKCIDFE
jgi:hypothetical protein